MSHFRHSPPCSPGKASSSLSTIRSDLKGFLYCMIIGLKSQRAFVLVWVFLLLSVLPVILGCSPLTSVSNVLPKVQRGGEGSSLNYQQLLRGVLTLGAQEPDTILVFTSVAYALSAPLTFLLSIPFINGLILSEWLPLDIYLMPQIRSRSFKKSNWSAVNDTISLRQKLGNQT